MRARMNQTKLTHSSVGDTTSPSGKAGEPTKPKTDEFMDQIEELACAPSPCPECYKEKQSVRTRGAQMV